MILMLDVCFADAVVVLLDTGSAGTMAEVSCWTGRWAMPTNF